MKKLKTIALSLLSLLVLLSGVSLAGAVGTWKNPTANPPANNVEAPINVGTDAQDKAGVLRVTGFRSFFDAIFDTKVQIGTTAIIPNSLKLLVAGDTGSRRYCDEAGNNCLTPGSDGWVVNSTPGGAGSCKVGVYHGSVGSLSPSTPVSVSTGISASAYPIASAVVTGGNFSKKWRVEAQNVSGTWSIKVSAVNEDGTNNGPMYFDLIYSNCNGSSSSGGSSTFGSWQEKQNGTVYRADTDGFVSAYARSLQQGRFAELKGYTDSNSNPTTLRTADAMSWQYTASISMPVRKGDYWKVVANEEGSIPNHEIYWLPIGS